jgi:hypothetical protein
MRRFWWVAPEFCGFSHGLRGLALWLRHPRQIDFVLKGSAAAIRIRRVRSNISVTI